MLFATVCSIAAAMSRRRCAGDRPLPGSTAFAAIVSASRSTIRRNHAHPNSRRSALRASDCQCAHLRAKAWLGSARAWTHSSLSGASLRRRNVPLPGAIGGTFAARRGSAPRASASEDLDDACDSALEDHVQPGMSVGVLSESVYTRVVRRLYALVGSMQLADVEIVHVTQRAREIADDFELSNAVLNERAGVDVAFAHAGKFDDELNFVLLNDASHSLLRARLLARAAKSIVLVATADAGNSPYMTNLSVPVELHRDFSGHIVRNMLRAPTLRTAGAVATLRRHAQSGEPVVTVDGNHIVDVNLRDGVLRSPESLAADLDKVPGVVAHGLYTGVADKAVIGCEDTILEKFPTSKEHELEFELEQEVIDQALNALTPWKVDENKRTIQLSVRCRTEESVDVLVDRLCSLRSRMRFYPELRTRGTVVAMAVSISPLTRREINFAQEVVRVLAAVRELELADEDPAFRGNPP